MPARNPPTGILVPIITIFNDDESINYEAHKKHILFMARAGVHGFVSAGSTAEAVALSSEEKILLIKATREVLAENGFDHLHIMAGTGAQSTREAIKLSKEAGAAGADSVICLPPSYFAPSITQDALQNYYEELADNSPLPIIIYSWPGVSSGLQINSDLITILAKHPNIIGYKGTDHDVGKMARVSAQNPGFFVLAGATDNAFQSFVSGAAGAITGLGNIAPRVSVLLWTLFTEKKYDELLKLQGLVSTGEWSLLGGGIPSLKYAVNHFYGYGGIPRRPIPASPANVREKVDRLMIPIMDLEKKLELAQK
ncbi:hypothetical protein BDY24DRAFT_346359 [Mrakia frigida]|uniref:dihydrodipicolinate synthase family protein n=1 Tax=Mrakia frigida TaxID=29902 RepID=UPI003FCC1C23